MAFVTNDHILTKFKGIPGKDALNRIKYIMQTDEDSSSTDNT